jgi:hypothetical protein
VRLRSRHGYKIFRWDQMKQHGRHLTRGGGEGCRPPEHPPLFRQPNHLVGMTSLTKRLVRGARIHLVVLQPKFG